MTRLVDLDDAAGLELAWMELAHRFAVRNIEPPLRDAIIRRCERLSAVVAEPILRELEEMHPALVLEAHFTTLVPNMPTIGAVHRRDCAQ